MGLLLVVLPWSAFWERNYFAGSSPLLHAILANNFVRGAVTGLGLVNLYVGFADLAQVFGARPSSASDRVEGREASDVSLPDNAGRS